MSDTEMDGPATDSLDGTDRDVADEPKPVGEDDPHDPRKDHADGDTDAEDGDQDADLAVE